MPTCMPTRLLATTDSHPANATPCLESAPHNLEACLQPAHAHRQHTTGRAHSGHRHPISCPVSRISSPQTAFNPHTLTALAAYCKSPYPHRSAYAASEHEKFSRAEHCRYGTRDFATSETHCEESVRWFHTSIPLLRLSTQ